MEKLKKLLDFGITGSEALVDLHKQRMFNLFMLMAMPFVFVALAVNIYNGKYLLAGINLIQLFIFGANIWVTYTRKCLELRVWSLVFLSIFALFIAIYFRTGTEYRVLVLMVAGVVIFDSNWKFFLFAFVISLLFSYVKYLDFKELGTVNNLIVLKVVQIFIPFLLTCISLFYLKHIYLNGYVKLQSALTEVSEAQNSQQRIMYSLAHDLRSPLSNVISISKLMKAEGSLTEEQKKWMDIIESSTNNSNALINELLHSNELLTKLEKIELADLNVLVSNMVLLAQLKANDKQINIKFKPSSKQYMLYMDVLKIQRLVSNLMNNAIKFSQKSQEIIVSVYPKDHQYHISIKDFGIGISEKQIPFIFDAFTKAKRKGTDNEVSYGLGLSICKQIAKQHKGDIAVFSETGKGTEFIVSLPMAVEQS